MTLETVGRYKIIAEMGHGGMSTVYSAHDPMFNREVAIKVLPRELLHDPTFRLRFEREARTIAALDHRAIVPVYDYGEADGQPFFVMRLMTGGSLADHLRRGPIRLEEAARIITVITEALDEAHRQGIIHRDLKPGNILFDQKNDPFLADFGIAKLNEAGATLTGNVIVGTPAYMSPEQGRGEKDIDGRSDVYSLGVILFEMLTGRVPFLADTPMGQIIKHMNSPIPEILTYQPGLPPDIQVVINRSMHKRKYGRFKSAGEMSQALQAVVAGKPIPALQAMSTYATLPGAETAGTEPQSTFQAGAPSGGEVLAQKEGEVPLPISKASQPEPRNTPQPKKKVPWFRRLVRTVGVVLLSLILLVGLVGVGLPFVVFHENPITFYKGVILGVPVAVTTLDESPTPSITPIPSPTKTPSPPKPLLPTKKSAPTTVKTSTEPAPPTPTQVNIYPVINNMGIPSPKETLTADNLDQMRKMIVSGNGGFLDIDLSEDASTLAVATTIGVDLYDFQTFEPIGWLASQNPVYDLDFSPDGKLLAVAEMESASIWDWHTQTLIHRLSPQEGDLIKNVAFSPSGQLIWGGSGSTQVWKAADGSQVLFVKGVHAEAASISVDDTILAAPTVNSVRLLNLADGSLQQELRAYGVHRAQFLPDGDTLLAIANDLVHGFSLQRGELTPSIGGQVPVVSWDGETLVSDNGEGKIQTWRLSGNSVPGFPFRQFDQIGYSLVDNHEPNYQISQNGEYLAYWNNWRGNFIFQDLLEEGRSWNGALSASSSLRTYNYGFYDLPGFYPQTKLLFSPLDPESIVTFWQNSIIESWDFTTEQEHRILQWVKDNTASRLPITINQYIMPDASQSVTSPDKTLIAKADAGKVLVTLANDSSVLHTIYANVIPKTDLVFSPDSSTLATISSGPTIRIWNMTNGRQICVINGDGADPDIADAKRLFFSDDHQKLAVYHARDQVSYWNASNCQRLDTYQVKDAAISPDGTFFIEPQIYQLNLRKLNDGSLIRSLYGLFDENTGRITLGFSKDGNFFGAIYTDGTAHIWGIIP